MTYLTTGCIVFDLLSLCFVVWATSAYKKLKSTEPVRSSQPFDELITSVLSDSVSVCPANLSSVVTKSLRDVAVFIDADYASIFVLDESKSSLRCEHEWCGTDIAGWKQSTSPVCLTSVPWISRQMLEDQVIAIGRR